MNSCAQLKLRSICSAFALSVSLLFSVEGRAWDNDFIFNDWMWYSESNPGDFSSNDRSIEKTAQGLMQVLRVTSDINSDYTDIRLDLDDKTNITSLRHFTNDVEQRTITPDEFVKGAVLMKSGGHEVVKLICKNCGRNRFGTMEIPSAGVSVDMVYLSNGITNSYETFAMFLRHQGDQWGLETTIDGKVKSFADMRIVARKAFWGGVIGIKEVIVN